MVGRHPCYSWTYNIWASSHLIPRPDLVLDTSWGYFILLDCMSRHNNMMFIGTSSTVVYFCSLDFKFKGYESSISLFHLHNRFVPTYSNLLVHILIWGGGQGVIGISGSLIWSKTPMEQIFNPCGEFRWSLEGPVSQIHFPHLHTGAPWIFSDLLRSVQMLKREWGGESNRKLPHLSIPNKTASWVTQFAVEDLPLSSLLWSRW